MRAGAIVAVLAGAMVVAAVWLVREPVPPRTARGVSASPELSGRHGAAFDREPSPTSSREAPAGADARAARDPGPIQAVEITPGFYEVRMRGLRALLDEPRHALGGLGVGAWPVVWRRGGPALEITSDLANGILTRDGLLVSDPKKLRLLGLEAGDMVLTVNNQPVSHLYLVVVELRRQPDARLVQLEVERGGARIRRSYEIRGL